MQYPIIDNLIYAYLRNGWSGINLLDNPITRLKVLVDGGKAGEYYNIGEQITLPWYRTPSQYFNAPWDVVNFYENGNVALNWHYAIPNGIPFDAPEAIYYFDGTETAGDYYIPVGSAYGAGWTVGLNIHFTLTEAPSEGDQLFIDCAQNYTNDPTAGRAWRVYANGDTVVKQSGTTSNDATGTNLGTIGNVNAQRTNGRLNAISRVVYGSGRWSESAIRQWLNSAANAGAWWEPKNPWDRPPTQASTIRGFLAGYSQEFLDVLDEVEVVTALNTQEGFAETTETTIDKIFLPSLQEWHISPQLANVEGEDWQYMIDLAEEDGRTGRFPTGTTIDILKRYNIASQSSSVDVWLRSAGRYAAGNAWIVTSSGYVNNYNAYYAFRCCPACKIQKFSNIEIDRESKKDYFELVLSDISHRLKLPLQHYFPHQVIDAIISAADGQQTAEENEILRHYLTPLGIGGI